MMMILFNSRALLNRQPVPEIPREKCDRFWMTANDKPKALSMEFYRQHLATQRGMEEMVQGMRSRGEPVANRPVSYHRNKNGHSGIIQFD